MERIHITREEFMPELGKKIVFFKLAEGGAMGMPGVVEFITDECKSYYFHMGNDVIGTDQISFVFPAIEIALEERQFGPRGLTGELPRGWNYVNLGAGNHLIVADSVIDRFNELTEKCERPSEIYQMWFDTAVKVTHEICGGKKMKNNITEIVFILDRSGSMAGFEADTIGGFNATIEKQRKEDGTAYVSTVLFDNESEVIHDRVPLDKIKPMTDKEYRVGGCTALLDAIGGAIHHIGNVHKYARIEDVPEHTIFVITTDGMENASHRYSSKKVKAMIERQREKYGWEFIFLAANIDAVETAENIGIKRERAVNYHQDAEGMVVMGCAMSDAIRAVRCDESLDKGSWREEADKDMKRKRGIR